MDIQKLSVIELKALCFDEIVKLESTQKNIQIINQAIAKKQEEAVPETSK